MITPSYNSIRAISPTWGWDTGMDEEEWIKSSFSSAIFQLWFQGKLDPEIYLLVFCLKMPCSLSQILKAPSVEVNEDTQYLQTVTHLQRIITVFLKYHEFSL